MIPESGRSPGGGHSYPLQHSCLENSMDRGAWQAAVCGVSKNRTRLSDFTSGKTIGFPSCSSSKESACNAGDVGLIPGLRIFPGEGNGNPLECSCLENPVDRGVWWAAVHGVTESRSNSAHTHAVKDNKLVIQTESVLPYKFCVCDGKNWNQIDNL